jgi:hypothetical protein
LHIVQSPQGYAHFFRRLPRKIYLKNNIIVLAIFQKNRAPNESLSAKASHKFKVPAFLLWFTDKKQSLFFFFFN